MVSVEVNSSSGCGRSGARLVQGDRLSVNSIKCSVIGKCNGSGRSHGVYCTSHTYVTIIICTYRASNFVWDSWRTVPFCIGNGTLGSDRRDSLATKRWVALIVESSSVGVASTVTGHGAIRRWGDGVAWVISIITLVFPNTSVTSSGNIWQCDALASPTSIERLIRSGSPFAIGICIRRVSLEGWGGSIRCNLVGGGRFFVPAFESVGRLTIVGGSTVARRLVGDGCARSRSI